MKEIWGIIKELAKELKELKRQYQIYFFVQRYAARNRYQTK
jgi:hypothetical protein